MYHTDRLELRPLTMDDLEPLHAILSDAETMIHYPHPFNRTKTQQWIEWNLSNYEQYGFGLWAVIRRDNGAFIGDCGITMQNIQGRLVPEIGFHLRKDQTGNGFATEAAQFCLQLGFLEFGFETLYSYSNESNVPSQRVAERIGMKVDEIAEDEWGKRTVIYSLSRSEYLTKHKVPFR